MVANLATLGQRLGGIVGGLPVKKVHNGLCALCIIWLVYSAAQVVLLFVPQASPDQSGEATVAGEARSAAGVVDISQLQSLNLFGVAGAAPIIPVVAAPVIDDVGLNAAKTKLDLSLEGVVYTLNTTESLAVIVHKNKQDQYYIGDKLPVGGKVVLAKVLLDHVILDNSGRYESLWLYDDEKKSSRARAAPSRAASNNKPKTTSNSSLAKGYRERLYKNPASLAEVLRITPAQRQGQMVGYRVSAGRDKQQFTQLGFKANDIVTAINDIELDEPSKALEVYKLMRTAKDATFTVDRNGESVQIVVSLGEDGE